MHLAHERIINYTGRPYKNNEEMNESLIKNWNEIVKPTDTIYHLGDFCFASNYKNWEARLNGKIIFFKGNHDKKRWLYSATIKFADYRVYMTHVPPDNIPEGISLVLCGHVHEKWKMKLWRDTQIPMINVGVDVWNYHPVGIRTLLNELGKWKKEIVK